MFKKIIIFVLLIFILNSCGNTEEKIKYQHNVPAVWTNDRNHWGFDDKGIILHGKYKNYYRSVMTLPALNYTEYLPALHMDMYTVFTLEKYKKDLDDNKTIYELHLTIFGYTKNINLIKISFDDSKYITYLVKKKDNIDLYFRHSDIDNIIKKLKTTKYFKIKYDDKQSYFNNDNFNQLYNKIK